MWRELDDPWQLAPTMGDMAAAHASVDMADDALTDLATMANSSTI
jgi:hypothetical protein